MPISSTSGSASSSPFSLTASATITMPEKLRRRRSATVRASRRDQQRAVLVEPRRRHLVDHAGRTGREPHQIAVAAQHDLADAGRARELGVLGEMQRLAVHRDRDARAHPAVKLLHLGAARMAGDVHQMGAVGDHLDALPHQPVDHLADRLLVARNGARGEDHQVALARASPPGAGPRRCARARRAARPGCRCTAPPPCRAADSRRPRRCGTPRCRRDSRISRATCATRSMARPTTTTSRPAAAAASATARMRATLEAKVVTATRPVAPAISSRSVFATSASDGERPSRTALVESPISARQPSSPSRLSFASSVGGPMIGVGSSFQSPVCSTLPSGVRMISAFDSGIECETDTSSTSNGPSVEAAAERHDLDRHVGAPRLAQALRLEQRGRERRRVDRAAQPRPQVDQRAEMVLVRMRQHEAGEVAPLLHQERDVRHDQVDAGQVVAGERRRRDRPPARCACRRRRARRARDSSRSRRPRRAARTAARSRAPSWRTIWARDRACGREHLTRP